MMGVGCREQHPKPMLLVPTLFREDFVVNNPDQMILYLWTLLLLPIVVQRPQIIRSCAW
jgi:hypothetical protein